MRIAVAGQAYRLDWQHTRFDVPLEVDLGRGRTTQVCGHTACVISPLDDAPPQGIIGVAWCAVGDTFTKETGRKVSLTHALQEWGISRSERAGVWDQYWRRGTCS